MGRTGDASTGHDGRFLKLREVTPVRREEPTTLRLPSSLPTKFSRRVYLPGDPQQEVGVRDVGYREETRERAGVESVEISLHPCTCRRSNLPLPD